MVPRGPLGVPVIPTPSVSSDPLALILALVGKACLTLLPMPRPPGAGLPAASGGPAGGGECGAGAGTSAEPGAAPGLSWGE